MMDRLQEIRAALDPNPVPCPYCKGKGEVYVEGSAQYKDETPEYRECDHCEGAGIDPCNLYSYDDNATADVRYLVAEIVRLREALTALTAAAMDACPLLEDGAACMLDNAGPNVAIRALGAATKLREAVAAAVAAASDGAGLGDK